MEKFKKPTKGNLFIYYSNVIDEWNIVNLKKKQEFRQDFNLVEYTNIKKNYWCWYL